MQLLYVWQQKRHSNTQRSIAKCIMKIEVETSEKIKQSISDFPPLTGSDTKQVPTWPVNASDIGPKVQSVRGLRF